MTPAGKARLPRSAEGVSLFIDDCNTATACYRRDREKPSQAFPFRPVDAYIAPLPDGPVDFCFDWSPLRFGCQPCDRSLSRDDLDARCAAAFPEDCTPSEAVCFAS